MAEWQPDDGTEGWLFRVTDSNVPSPRYFVAGLPLVDEARHDTIEVVGHVSVHSMSEFEVSAGEVKQIDTPYP